MAVNSTAAANEFLRLASGQRTSLTPMQLMKLVYIAHGWMLGLYGRPLVSDQIEAWKYGPVIPELYHAMKSYGGRAIDRELPPPDFGRHADLDVIEKNTIEQTFKLYGHLNGIQLSELTHRAGTPWSATFDAGVRGAPISNDLISHHYRRIYDERSAITAHSSENSGDTAAA